MERPVIGCPITYEPIYGATEKELLSIGYCNRNRPIRYAYVPRDVCKLVQLYNGLFSVLFTIFIYVYIIYLYMFT